MAGSFAILVGQIHRVHHLAIDIELQLAVGRVADAHRAGVLVTAQVIERLLRHLMSAIDAVQDLQRSLLGVIIQQRTQPRLKLLRLLHIAQPHHGIQA